MAKFDFGGWATRNDLLCSDGRTIKQNAFQCNDGQTVPLVWNHQHNNPEDVLGHALLENRDEGVYAYCSFNDTESGKYAKELVRHGDITSLSIYANKLKQIGGDVIHGIIREVSLVHAGANPGAQIETVLAHGDEEGEGMNIWYNENIAIYHSAEDEDTNVTGVSKGTNEPTEPNNKDEKEDAMGADLSHAACGPNDGPTAKNNDEKTLQDVIDTMTEEQKNAMYALVGMAIENNEGGTDEMEHNVFNQDQFEGEAVLSHADIENIFRDAKRSGSLKEAFLAHAENYGIKDIEMLFPDATDFTNQPEFIKRKTDWVADVVDGAHHSPFARVKTTFADITADEARAKGYTKGNRKIEEVFTLLKRTTEPCTIYKKQKLDRDDIVDITDFDVVAFVKGEMRIMIEEEIGRAALIGDGRLTSSDDKIPEDHIRPIWKDDDLYAIHYLADSFDAAKFIDDVITTMADYEGSGSPKMFAPQNVITACLLLKDSLGHRMYKTKEELATALGVSKIVPVPVMKDQVREDKGVKKVLDAIIVNMNDYNFGADKGGSVNMFDDFDIDYNQYKYLMETRCSGALTKVKSAVVMEHKQTQAAG